MIIEKISVDQINPAEYNPRIDLKPGDQEYEKLKRSINEFGYVEPLVWNKQTGNLVGGHQRFKILLEKGLNEVEVSVVDIDPLKEKALNIALNKISGNWDDEKLAAVLEDLQENASNLETGFDPEEMNRLIDQFTIENDSLKEFMNQELEIGDYAEENFKCTCPRCGFSFDPKDNT